jgi:pantoate--beta-alanine ligase
VVAKLLLAAMPDVAIFGEKDYQQLLVVKRLVADLDIPTHIIGAPTLREADGLALSSRNAYLTEQERVVAPKLNMVLRDVSAKARAGKCDGDLRAIEQRGVRALQEAGFDKVDYVAIRDAETLAMIDVLDRPARVLAAAHLGRTRLIDNMPIA